MFAAEKVPHTPKIILEQFREVEAIFADVADLSQVEAVNLKTEQKEPIPDVTIFVSGFSCVSRAKQGTGH